MSEDASDEKKKLIYQARLAEHCERYEDMVEAMKTVAQKYSPIDVDERNLLSVGYKNIVGVRRTAWRTFNYMLTKAPDDQQLVEYMKRVEDELDEKCNEIISDILSSEFIDKSEKPEDKVFYLKMKGDYYRYMAEYKRDADRAEVANNALEAYKEADRLSQKDLPYTDTIRLGLALNFSVFYFEILNEQSKACELAKQAYDSAEANIEKLSEGDYKDAHLILQLLRDNLTLWQSEVDDDVEGQKPGENGEDKDDQ